MSEIPVRASRIALLEWRDLDAFERFSALAVSGAFGAVLLVALWLHPDARGLGTHQQLGLPPCTFQAVLHIPCPTCGMTTAFSLMARGHPVEAFYCQPAGASLFIAGALASVACLLFAAWGRWPVCLDGLLQRKAFWVAVLVVLGAAWNYKIVQAL